MWHLGTTVVNRIWESSCFEAVHLVNSSPQKKWPVFRFFCITVSFLFCRCWRHTFSNSGRTVSKCRQWFPSYKWINSFRYASYWPHDRQIKKMGRVFSSVLILKHTAPWRAKGNPHGGHRKQTCLVGSISNVAAFFASFHTASWVSTFFFVLYLQYPSPAETRPFAVLHRDIVPPSSLINDRERLKSWLSNDHSK